MRLRTLTVLVVAFFMLLAGTANAQAQTVTLAPNGGSGISATLTINGTNVTGTATGLNPAKRYISLYYGDQSTAQTGQLFTCADARTAASPRQWGLTPEWNVNSDGTGTLNAKAPRNTSDVYTVSIREVASTALPDPYQGFNPVTYPVRACGQVQPNNNPIGGGGPLGTVPNPLPPIPTLPLPVLN